MKSNIIISAPHIIVPNNYWTPLLGETLRDAGLITEAQLQTVLRDKQEYKEQKVGEILALRGWLKQENIEYILYIQKRLPMKFGKIAVNEGLLKKRTVNFFLENLFCQPSIDTIFLT